jgi:hypothetical protein
LLNKTNFEIAAILPKADDAPPSMCGIYVSPGATVATDGRCMLMVTAPEAQPSLFDSLAGITPMEAWTPFVLDKESALRVAKNIPKSNGEKEQLALIDQSTEGSETAIVAVDEVVREEIMRARKINCEYPDFQKAIPEIGGEKLAISFDSELLLGLMKCYAKFAGRVTLRIYEPIKGMRLDGEENGQRMIGVIMPLCQTEEDGGE